MTLLLQTSYGYTESLDDFFISVIGIDINPATAKIF
jgi:hypothetical protein